MKTVDVITLTYQSVRSYLINSWVTWVCHVHRAGNIYCQDKIYPLIKSKHSFENVTRLITENCSLVDNSYQHVW